MAITTEQIHATADQLASEGIKPTQTNVRERLGSGSFTTIAEALRSWRAEQETVAELQAVVIPQDISDRTQVLVAQVWETAQFLANDRLSKEREALAHKEALLVVDNDEMQRIVAMLENEQSALTAKLDELTANNADQLKQINELNKSSIQQGNELQKLNDKLLSERDKSAGLQDDLQQAQGKLEQLSQTIATLTATNAKHEAEKQAQTDTIEHLRADLATALSDLKNEQGKSENHLKDLSHVSANLANLEGQSKTLAEQLEKSQALTATQTTRIEMLTADLATAKAKIEINKSKPTTKGKQGVMENDQ